MTAEMNSSRSELMGLGGARVALESVHVNGEINGFLLHMKIRQLYRNTTDENIETVYTFPLAWGTTLLGLTVELNGRKMKGTVIEKANAEDRYERAIENGDAPVMLEWAGKDLYTANIGNLMPGDDAVIEIEYGQLLGVQNGNLRIAMPCTLAPRYEEAHKSFRDAMAHHFYKMNPLAEYRFHLELKIVGPLARSSMVCPTHSISKSSIGDTMVVRLDKRAMLDRDFVLNIAQADDLAVTTYCEDQSEPGRFIALTSFTPSMPATIALKDRTSTPMQLKILVDCSGSMAGDSMSQARSALSAFIDQLHPDDCISFSKFGAQTANILGTLTPCTPDHLQNLKEEVHRLDATMDGTELGRAINRVMVIKDNYGLLPESAGILLITDGEVWDIEGIVATVRNANHRIFAIGVGSAPAESLVQELAAVSGGACTMVTPKENMKSSVLGMITKIRSRTSIHVTTEFGVDPTWQSATRVATSDTETIHCWSSFNTLPTAAPALSWCVSEIDSSASEPKMIQPHLVASPNGGMLARMLAAQQLLDIIDEGAVRDLALKYQLVTRFTNFFLVFEREDKDKPGQLPRLQQIEHMMAAGWMGASTVFNDDVPAFLRKSTGDLPDLSAASPFRGSRISMRTHPGGIKKPLFAELAHCLDRPDYRENPVKRLIESFNRRAIESNNFREAWGRSSTEGVEAMLDLTVKDIAKDCGVTPLQVWALFVVWLGSVNKFTPPLNRFGNRMARGAIVHISEEVRQRILAVFEHEAKKPVAPLILPDDQTDDIPAFLRMQVD